MMRILPGLMVALLLFGCPGCGNRPGPERTENQGNPGDAAKRFWPNSGNHFASRFTIDDTKCLKILRVFDPWQNSSNVRYTYILGNGSCRIPDSLSHFPFIQVPVRRVVTMSTTHAAMIVALGEEASLVGASGTDYLYSPLLRERVQNGSLKEVGSPQALNYENLVALRPDVVFFYGVEGSTVPAVDKLKELGIQVVYCAEYLEAHPLGKAEWMLFFASFYGLGEKAGEFCAERESEYMRLAELAGETSERPGVMLGLPWKEAWFVAGGKSYAAKLIEDAGGTYLWGDLNSGEAIPMDLESVYSRAVRADVWLNPGAAQSLDELLGFDARFADLPALKKERIYNNDARMSPGGGNDYWESGTVYPDRVLADLITILHPGLLPDDSLYYYRKLK